MIWVIITIFAGLWMGFSDKRTLAELIEDILKR